MALTAVHHMGAACCQPDSVPRHENTVRSCGVATTLIGACADNSAFSAPFAFCHRCTGYARKRLCVNLLPLCALCGGFFSKNVNIDSENIIFIFDKNQGRHGKPRRLRAGSFVAIFCCGKSPRRRCIKNVMALSGYWSFGDTTTR